MRSIVGLRGGVKVVRVAAGCVNRRLCHPTPTRIRFADCTPTLPLKGRVSKTRFARLQHYRIPVA
jgi:hypothetical protein